MASSDAVRLTNLPDREGGLGFTSRTAVTGAAYVGCQAIALGCVLTAASVCGLPTLLERLSRRPLAKELIAALKEAANIAMEWQLKDAEDGSWAIVATGKDTEGKGMGNLLSEVGSWPSGGCSDANGHIGDGDDSTALGHDYVKGAMDEIETETETALGTTGESTQLGV